ncbi:hypothetical protein Tco_0753296 [Tanacetum coccineum]
MELGLRKKGEKGPSEPVEDDSPVEEVAAVKPKRKYTRRRRPIKKSDKEFVGPWTIEEDVALCKAWVSASENSIEGNGKKASGFWTEVTEFFHKEMGKQKRSYASVNCKWKNRIRPKVSQFCEIYNIVKDRHQSGSCDTTIYQEAKIEYRTIFNAPFALTDCWKILKDHYKWKKIEMPKGFRAKKKASSSGARLETLVAGEPSLVDALLSKFTMAATPFFSQRKESSSVYLRIKERELELEDQKRREQGELERLKIAQRDKELELQQKIGGAKLLVPNSKGGATSAKESLAPEMLLHQNSRIGLRTSGSNAAPLHLRYLRLQGGAIVARNVVEVVNLVCILGLVLGIVGFGDGRFEWRKPRVRRRPQEFGLG